MDAEARERRIRLRNEERAKRLQGGDSLYNQPCPVLPKEQEIPPAIAQYADQLFDEMLQKERHLGEKTLASMLPPARYEEPPKPAVKPPSGDTPVASSRPQTASSRPQTASKISKEQYKVELLAQIQEERRRKEQARADYKGTSEDLVLPKPHVRKQDPNRPSEGNPLVEPLRPHTALNVPSSRIPPESDVTDSVKAAKPVNPGQSLMDLDMLQPVGPETPVNPVAVRHEADLYEIEKAKLLYERQQAREELLRVREEMLNEKERRLNQMIHMLQMRQMLQPAYFPPPAAPPQPPLLEVPEPKAPPALSRKLPPQAPVEASLRSSSKLITPEVYGNPSVLLFQGDHSPYESMMQAPAAPLPRTEIPLPIRTSLIQQFPDMASEATLTLPETESVLSSAREVPLSEPRYGDSQSVLNSQESLRNEYEENFETALLQNFSLTNEWKSTSSRPPKSPSIEEEAVPYAESEGSSSEAVVTPPPTSYTRQLLLEYRKQR